jgi:hypothetical protein
VGIRDELVMTKVMSKTMIMITANEMQVMAPPQKKDLLMSLSELR